MGEYVPLQTFNNSSSEESLFDRVMKGNSDQGVRRRGGGYVAVDLNGSGSDLSSVGSIKGRPTINLGGAVAGAGENYQKIFETQLGAAAGDPRNPISSAINQSRNEYYGSVPFELRRLPLADRDKFIKPYGEPWNSINKRIYNRHWKLVQDQEFEDYVKQKKYILPFSNNIGPGNDIAKAKSGADVIAQGHDLHYQYAQSDADIAAADREAISQFAYEAINGLDPVSQNQAFLGVIGLGVKHAVESALGYTIYGKNETPIT